MCWTSVRAFWESPFLPSWLKVSVFIKKCQLKLTLKKALVYIFLTPPFLAICGLGFIKLGYLCIIELFSR